MGLFDEVRKSLMDLVLVLPKVNRENRGQIRQVILELQTEIERSVTLTTLYLDGVSRIIPRQELLDHLHHAPQNLLDHFNELKICAGLYGLKDRFEATFSSLPASVDMGKVSSVRSLIHDLAQGERLVIDGLRATTEMLADAARDLDQLHGQEFDDRKAALYTRVQMERSELRNQVTMIRSTVKDVLKTM